MEFDKRIERIYLKEPAAYNEAWLKHEISEFPEKHRLLVAARATFIKWKLIFEGKIARDFYIKEACGLCVRTGDRANSCSDCPGWWVCMNRAQRSTQDIMMSIYEIYMNEHNKFV